MSSKIVEGFSLTHAAILDGTVGAEEYVVGTKDFDIYGVRTGSIAVDTGNYDNTGDDAVLSSWFWFNFATVTVQAGYMSFDTMAKLSGSAVTTTDPTPTPPSPAVSNSDVHSIALWDEKSLNTAPSPMIIRMPAKDKNGLLRTIDFVLYRVQFGPINFDGPAYKSGLLINYTGRATMSDQDEKGVTLGAGKRAIGRVVNRPSV